MSKRHTPLQNRIINTAIVLLGAWCIIGSLLLVFK
jgi:hypothetical protein